MKKNCGFTLIEILVALAVIAIALTAMLKASSQNVSFTERVKNKTVSHWVAMQGATIIQLGLTDLGTQNEITRATTMLGQTWYWHAKIIPTPVKHMQKISILVSQSASGPFRDELIAFRYLA